MSVTMRRKELERHFHLLLETALKERAKRQKRDHAEAVEHAVCLWYARVRSAVRQAIETAQEMAEEIRTNPGSPLATHFDAAALDRMASGLSDAESGIHASAPHVGQDDVNPLDVQEEDEEPK